jgi:hypothetical protein
MRPIEKKGKKSPKPRKKQGLKGGKRIFFFDKGISIVLNLSNEHRL